jgi:hypothetical protein
MPFLRRWQQQIKELVRTSNPTEKTFVMDIDDAVDIADLEVVIGVGLNQRLELQAQGIVGQDRYDLLRDIISPHLPENHTESMKLIVSSVLPKFLTGRTNTPIYKYLRAANLLTEDGALKSDDVPTRVQFRVAKGMSFFKAGSKNDRDQAEQAASKVKDFNSYLESSTWWEFARLLPYFDRGMIDFEALREALAKELAGPNDTINTYVAKVICMYDLMTYRQEVAA